MLEKIKSLRFPLPEEIEKLKQSGYFQEAEKLIRMKLEDPAVPSFMKERLTAESEILKRLPLDYPYTEEEALAMIREEIPDFTMEELHQWEDNGGADWFMVDGRRHLQDRFFASMKKVYPEIAARAGEEPEDKSILDENIRYMKEHGSTVWHIHMKASARIKDSCFKPGRVLVHLPVPAASDNMKNIRILATEPDECILADEAASVRTAAFEADLEENRTFSVEYEYDSYVKYCDPDPSEVTSVLTPQPEYEPHMVFTPMIRELTRELSGDETNPLILARRFYDFVTEHVVYSFMREYITLGIIPDYCLKRLKGDCGVQALTFIMLCRCAGIEAKWQSGKFVTPDLLGNHDWAMFRIEPYGWLFADCSFGGSAYRAGSEERHRFYFGNLDPFRMAAANDFQQEFTPAKKHWRIDPYDNQKGEIEYDDRGLLSDEIDFTCELIEMTRTE